MKIRMRSENFITIIYILVFVSAICKLRYTLYESPLWDRGSNYSLFFAVISSLSYIILKRKLYMNRIKILLFFLIIYELFVSLVMGLFVIPNIFIDVIPWPIIFLVFYDYARDGEIPLCFKQITIIGLAIVCILCLPNIGRHLAGYGFRGRVVFPIYYSFAFLPMIYLMASKKIAVTFSIIISFLLMISTKRAGFIAVILGIIMYLIAEAYIQDTMRESLKKMAAYGVFLVAAAFAGSYLIQRYNLDIISRILRIFDDEGSGRLDIWRQVWMHFRDSKVVEKILGHGYHAIMYNIQISGNEWLAHNSLLETLYDYGFVGLTAILIIMFSIFKTAVVLLRQKNAYAPIMCYTVPLLMMMAFVSYFFEQSMIILPFCVVWGIIMGKSSAKKIDGGY